MMAELDLSTAQQEQIAALRSTMEEQTAQTREALDEKRSEMHALWSAETPDRDAILAKQVEMDELRRELRTAHIDFRLAVRALLTPEQRAKLDATRGRGRGGRHGRGGRGPGAGHGWGGGMGPGAGPCWTDADQ
jgi:Spy/CpxP family protein refolding chaperone